MRLCRGARTAPVFYPSFANSPGSSLRGGKRFGMTVNFSCIIDEKPKYARQALLWAASLLTYGQVPADALVVHTVDGCAPEYQRVFDSWGIRLEKAGRFEHAALRCVDNYVPGLEEYRGGAFGFLSFPRVWTFSRIAERHG